MGHVTIDAKHLRGYKYTKIKHHTSLLIFFHIVSDSKLQIMCVYNTHGFVRYMMWTYVVAFENILISKDYMEQLGRREVKHLAGQ